MDGGDRIQRVRNGSNGVFFFDEPGWQPYELVRVSSGPKLFRGFIVDSANFVSHKTLSPDDQKWLYKTWLFCQFFDSLHPTKPLLLICGEKGGGKSSALRKWLKLLFGTRAEVTGLERSKADGFIATVSSQPVAVFDNVDEHIGWLPDHLAQLATGMSIRRRKYYTTNEQEEYAPKCWVALTSRTPKFIDDRDDVLDRTLILQTERRPDYVAEQRLLSQIRENRDQLFTELLRELNHIVRYFREHGHDVGKVNFRMADFASFALMIGRAQDQEARAKRILSSMEHRQTDMLLGEEPIYLSLVEWLKNPCNVDREATSADLHTELGEISIALGVGWKYHNPHSLGQRLRHIKSNLKQRFHVTVRSDSANQNHYSFRPKTEAHNGSEATGQAIQL